MVDIFGKTNCLFTRAIYMYNVNEVRACHMPSMYFHEAKLTLHYNFGLRFRAKFQILELFILLSFEVCLLRQFFPH